MKTFEQAKDVLDNVQELHEKAGQLYLKLSRKTKSERMKLLLDYMSQNEEKLKENIASYGRNASPRILGAWFQYTQGENATQFVEELGKSANISTADMTVEEITELSHRIEDYLEGLFTEVSDMARNRDVKEVFRNLSEMEKENKISVTRVINSIHDF